MSSVDGKKASKNGFKYYVVSKDGAFMRLSPGHKMYFRGKVRFKPIKGVWTILGYELGPESPAVNVYCPTGWSYLCIETTLQESKSPKEEKKILKTLGLESNSDIIDFLSESTHMALLERLPDAPWNLFLASHLVYSQIKLPIFEKNKVSEASSPFESVLDIRQLNPHSPRLFKTSPEWEIALKSVQISKGNGIKSPKVLIAGGKGVGKSSFSKYLVNRLLGASPIVFIDLDPGQAEFTPPGFISAHVLKKPILGPNFTHIHSQPPVSYYVGDVNMSNCSERFMNCILSLLKDLEGNNYGPYPWVINTMGFNKGLGLVFMVDTIRLFKPTTIVNIQSRFPKKNYDLDFSPPSISTLSTHSWFTKPGGDPLEYNVLQFQALPESPDVRDMRSHDNWGIPEPKKIRDIALLSYLGATLFSQKDFFSRKIRSLHELTPISVPWNEVCIQLLHVPSSESKHALDILNASIVSLGSIQNWDQVSLTVAKDSFRIIPKTVIVKSLGLGIIRSVDKAKRVFYLLTSLKGPALASVNCFSCGAIYIPEGVFQNPSNSKLKGTPYVQSKRGKAPTNPLDRPWRRHFKPNH